jgi:murein DD-endopeptidase MepM/ murein hydrolase activator NlpD
MKSTVIYPMWACCDQNSMHNKHGRRVRAQRYCLAIIATLLVVLAGAIPLGVSAAGEPVRLIHITDGSKTLGQIARAYHVTAGKLALTNGLVLDEPLVAGLRLRIPSGSPADGPVTGVTITPTIPGQGETLVFQVATSAGVSLTATFDDVRVAVDGSGLGLAGVHPLDAPGEHFLKLRATDTHGLITEVVWPVRVASREFDEQHIELDSQTSALLAPDLVAAERAKLSSVWAKTDGLPQWTGTFTYPLTIPLRQTTGFGTRRTYNDGQLYGFHEGLDFGAPQGTPVYAPADGQVVLAEPLAVRGNGVILYHGMGVVTGYWHLSRIDVKAGQVVHQGDQLGLVGTTGLSTGPHLHWEMRIAGVPVNPRSWVEQKYP